MISKLIIISFIVFALNIPFGYWRANVKRLSFQWILAVHIPVPFIVFLRIYSELGFVWYTYVFLVGAFFLGQKLGGLIKQKNELKSRKVSSCMVMDLLRACCL